MMQDRRRIAQLQERMRENRIGLAVVGPTSNLLWLSGLNPHGDERPVPSIVARARQAS